jgi:arginyl-tRNA synthetase
MTFLADLKQRITKELEITEVNFSYPQPSSLGDLSLSCFEWAKKKKQEPAEVAKAWAAKLTSLPELKKYFFALKAVGSYLNFFLAPEFLSPAVILEIKQAKAGYGSNSSGQKKKVMIEYSNGNTHKEYHVGHLRNISYGEAIYKLLKANGYQVIPVSYINDFGIHVAKTIWNWQRDESYQTRPENKGYLLGQCYAAASKELTLHPEFQPEVTNIMKDIESRQGGNYQLWLQTRAWSLKYFQFIYQELGVKFQHIFYENELIPVGLTIVKKLLKKGILVKSEGAIIANLEKYDLGVLPIIRSDGTALYPVADLALASEKFKKYQLDQSIYVIDVRQSLYFKQLFKILELNGYQPAVFHLAYDFVTLPNGMMSSRTGNIITYEELREKLNGKLTVETKKRHPDWTVTRVAQVAEKLSVSTIKFELLKVGADKVITFDIEEAARFDGYTACYLQYGYARLKSIIRKEGFSFWAKKPDLTQLREETEKALLVKLAKYPELITLAAVNYNPSELTRYLFELVQLFSDYYHEVNILKAEKNLRSARLELIKALAAVLNNGFSILGFQILEEM